MVVCVCACVKQMCTYKWSKWNLFYCQLVSVCSDEGHRSPLMPSKSLLGFVNFTSFDVTIPLPSKRRHLTYEPHAAFGAVMRP